MVAPARSAGQSRRSNLVEQLHAIYRAGPVGEHAEIENAKSLLEVAVKDPAANVYEAVELAQKTLGMLRLEKYPDTLRVAFVRILLELVPTYLRAMIKRGYELVPQLGDPKANAYGNLDHPMKCLGALGLNHPKAEIETIRNVMSVRANHPDLSGEIDVACAEARAAYYFFSEVTMTPRVRFTAEERARLCNLLATPGKLADYEERLVAAETAIEDGDGRFAFRMLGTVSGPVEIYDSTERMSELFIKLGRGPLGDEHRAEMLKELTLPIADVLYLKERIAALTPGAAKVHLARDLEQLRDYTVRWPYSATDMAQAILEHRADVTTPEQLAEVKQLLQTAVLNIRRSNVAELEADLEAVSKLETVDPEDDSVVSHALSAVDNGPHWAKREPECELDAASAKTYEALHARLLSLSTAIRTELTRLGV